MAVDDVALPGEMVMIPYLHTHTHTHTHTLTHTNTHTHTHTGEKMIALEQLMPTAEEAANLLKVGCSR